MQRRLKDGVIWEICKYCANTEVPAIFALWCGISAVSASLGRNVFTDQGHYTVYPNLYIVLVAGSGRCRKSTAIGIAEKFIRGVNPRITIFSQKATPEGLISALKDCEVEGESMVRSTSEGIIIADELSTLIDRSAFNGMAQLLTTMFDSKDMFSYQTRSRGEEIICNACVSILGGSTIDWIRDSIPPNAIGGGFTARFVFVYRETQEKLFLWTKLSDENRERADNIIHDLNLISTMHGPFDYSQEARDECERIYQDFRRTNPLSQNKYLSGYASRRHTLLFKLAMVLSASVDNNRMINKEQVEMAQDILNRAEKDMPMILQAIASEGSGTLTSEVLGVIGRHHKISRVKLLSLMHHKLQAHELDRIIDTLTQSQEVFVKNEDKRIYYSCKPLKEESEKSFTEKILNKEKKDE